MLRAKRDAGVPSRGGGLGQVVYLLERHHLSPTCAATGAFISPLHFTPYFDAPDTFVRFLKRGTASYKNKLLKGQPPRWMSGRDL